MQQGDSLVGKVVGNYKVFRELGRGGMGVVYKAHEMSLNRVVALKVLPSHHAQDRALVKRFMREARAAASLNHPNIVTIHAVGEHDGVNFIAMEYVKGMSLADFIRKRGQLDTKQALHIAIQAATALKAAHQSDIIHRDIKPQNIMIDQAFRVKLMDFGLAKVQYSASSITAHGVVVGTPRYMSPEQCNNEPLDVRTDIFSLGVVLYEMLAGAPPFDAESPMALMRKIVESPLPHLRDLNRDVPPALLDIVEIMTNKNRSKRYPTVDALIADLHAASSRRTPLPSDATTRRNDASTALQQPQTPPSAARADRPAQSPPEPAQSGGRKTNWPPFALGAAALAIICAAGYAFYALGNTGATRSQEPPVPVMAVTESDAASARDRAEAAQEKAANVQARQLAPSLFGAGQQFLRDGNRAFADKDLASAIKDYDRAGDSFERSEDLALNTARLEQAKEDATEKQADYWAPAAWQRAQVAEEAAHSAIEPEDRIQHYADASGRYDDAASEAETAAEARIAKEREIAEQERRAADSNLVRNYAGSEWNKAEDSFNEGVNAGDDWRRAESAFREAAQGFSFAREIANTRETDARQERENAYKLAQHARERITKEARTDEASLVRQGESAWDRALQAGDDHKRAAEQFRVAQGHFTDAMDNLSRKPVEKNEPSADSQSNVRVARERALESRNKTGALEERYAPSYIAAANNAWNEASRNGVDAGRAVELFNDAADMYDRALEEAALIKRHVAADNIDILLRKGLKHEHQKEYKRLVAEGKIKAQKEETVVMTEEFPINY